MQHPISSYTRTAIALHWIIFILIVCDWGLGYYVTDLPFSPQKLRYISWHKWLGVTVWMIAVARLAWRLLYPVPPFARSMPLWQRRSAAAMHGLLYALLVLIPITGWLFSSATGVPTVYLGFLQLPDLLQKDKALADALRQVHATLNWTLVVLVCGHAAFALKHHLVDRDDVLQRMLPFHIR